MVRPADYIYGVVPERGEYDIESRPEREDRRVLSRVESITSSFEWSATAANDVEAIAVDLADPPLLVRIITDPRDPDKRASVCMHVWIVAETEAVATMIAELWPREVDLPITQEDFLQHLALETTGRIVVGPNNLFKAVGFDQSWGARTTTHQEPTKSSPSLAARETTTPPVQNTNVPKDSSIMLKAFAILSTIALIATAVFAAIQNWEIQRLQRDVNELAGVVKRLADQKEKTEKELDLKKSKLAESERSKKQLEAELGQLRADKENLNNKIAELLKENPGKEDQAELHDLRSFKAAVENHIDGLYRSLEELHSRFPDTRPDSKNF
jgi:hypothetical protein